MECDICFEKFDKSINKPLSLFRCAHTICANCVKNLPTKECPTCRIEDAGKLKILLSIGLYLIQFKNQNMII
jgi:hypothetical protein